MDGKLGDWSLYSDRTFEAQGKILQWQSHRLGDKAEAGEEGKKEQYDG